MEVVEARTSRPFAETTTMIVIGIILGAVGIGFFCWLLFTLAVYALPFFASVAAGLIIGQGILAAQPSPYPAAPRGGVVEEMHGTRVADPYRWLEELDSRRTAEWVKAQNGLTRDS